MSLLEAASLYAGETWSDDPCCVSPVLRVFARTLNNGLNAHDRQRLIPFATRLIGTADDGFDPCRRLIAYDWLQFAVSSLVELAGPDALAERSSILSALKAVHDSGHDEPPPIPSGLINLTRVIASNAVSELYEISDLITMLDAAIAAALPADDAMADSWEIERMKGFPLLVADVAVDLLSPLLVQVIDELGRHDPQFVFGTDYSGAGYQRLVSAVRALVDDEFEDVGAELLGLSQMLVFSCLDLFDRLIVRPSTADVGGGHM